MRNALWLKGTALAAFFAVGALANETDALRENWKELSQRNLRLTPVPKTLRFVGAPVKIAGKIAVVIDKKTPKGQIAVDELLSRVRELAPETRIAEAEKPLPGYYNFIVENHFPNAFHAEKGVPAEAKKTDQAYAIFPRENGVVLAGNGEQGMLYAAVTARWLIERAGDAVVFYPARVIDWPDFKDRGGSDFCGIYHLRNFIDGKYDAQIAYMKRLMDFLFRLKFNGVREHSLYLPVHVPTFDKPSYSEQHLACLKTINDYAFARGVVPFFYTTTALGFDPEDSARAETRDMFRYKVHNQYHSLAPLDLHRRRARRIADFCEKTGFRSVGLHMLDGGGPFNPEHWFDRDAASRAKYSDNQRADADADVLNVYAEELLARGVVPMATIYPYSPEWSRAEEVARSAGLELNAGNRKKIDALIADLKRYYLAFNQKLHAGVPVCMREGVAADFAKIREWLPGRPLWVYFVPTHSQGRVTAMVSPNVRCFGAAYSATAANDAIAYYPYDRKFVEQQAPVAAEYAWNAAFPEAADWLAGGTSPEAFDRAGLAVAAERAAVGFWGGQLGPILKDMFADRLSLELAVDPKKATNGLVIGDMEKTLDANRLAAIKAEKAMDKAWATILENRKRNVAVVDAFSYPWFVQYYGMIKAARAYAEVNFSLEKAYNFSVAGKMTEVDAALKQAENALSAGAAEYARVAKELKNEQKIVTWDALSAWDKTHLTSQLIKPDFTALKEKIVNARKNATEVFAAHNMPPWFRAALKKPTPFFAEKASGVNLDGRLDEPVWKTARPVEIFVGWQASEVFQKPIVASMLYDDRQLVLGFSVKQPLIARIQTPKRPMDQRAETESVEWFIVPDPKNPEVIYQVMVDTAGNVYTQKHLPKDQLRGVDFGLKTAVSKTADGWACEIAVPFAALGRSPGEGWKTLVGYNHIDALVPFSTSIYASNVCDGKAFTASLKSPLVFADRAPVAETVAAPDVQIINPTLTDRTYSAGAGTFVSFDLKIETKKPLYDAETSVEILEDKNVVLYRTPLLSGRYIALAWQSEKPIGVQLAGVHPGVALKIGVSYRYFDGVRRVIDKTFKIGAVSAAASPPPVSAEGFSGSGWFDPENALDPKKGSLEFWVCSRDVDTSREEALEKGLFHYGPPRPDNPRLVNYSSIALRLIKNATLIFSVTNSDYDSRSVTAEISGWKERRRHHIACVWDFTGGRSAVRLYIDGKLASDKITGYKTPGSVPLTITRQPPYSAWLGSLVGGVCPADAVFAGFKLRPEVAYDKDFAPSLDSAAPAAPGLVFPFNRTLKGTLKEASGSAREIEFYPSGAK